jgi:TonB family protein
MFRLSNLLAMLLFLVACLAPQRIRAEQVDTALIRKILGTENLPHTDQMDDETSREMLDRIANYETRNLDPGNREWTVSSSKWKAVYDRIHADLESELPNTTLQTNDLKRQQDYEDDIASHLSQSDVDSILAYYSTPEGQRYQGFKRRIDEIMAAGVASSLAKEDVQSTAAWPAPEQAKQYARMLVLSHAAESIMAQVQIAEAAGGDTSASTVLHIYVAGAIKKSPQELGTLSREYENDLSGFEAFSKTAAAQHLFTAMAHAMFDSAKKNPLADSIIGVEQKHAGEWKAFYLAQVGGPPSAEVLSKSENSTPVAEPPKGQVAAPQRLRISSAVAERNLLHKVEPEYPEEAKTAHVEGNVILQGIINKEGDVAELRLVSGQPLLANAAMDAVKQWQYKPYLLNGDPIEVETTIIVRFHM